MVGTKLKTLTENYDTTAIMAMPYMENEQAYFTKKKPINGFFLIENVKAQRH